MDRLIAISRRESVERWQMRQGVTARALEEIRRHILHALFEAREGVLYRLRCG